MPTDHVTVTVDLPREAIPGDQGDPGALAAELRLLWVIDQVRRGTMSIGYGAGLVGQDRWTFIQTLDAHGVPAIGYSVEDLERELELLESL